MDHDLLLGTHVSIAGGVDKAIERAVAIGCTAIQIFTRNASRWQVPPLTAKTVEAFRQARAAGCVHYVAAHSSYLINLASPEAQTRQRSLTAFKDELDRCQRLGLDALVVHPGAHMGEGITAGIATVVRSLSSVCRESDVEVRILLENTAGQGTGLGAAVEELGQIIEAVADQRLGICLDTCHAFAAGYELRTAEGYESLISSIDRHIGSDKVNLFHLNDSKKPLGSRLDRHEHVGQGLIGVDGFRLLMQDERFRHSPKVTETPPGDNNCHDLENLALLKKLSQVTSIE